MTVASDPQVSETGATGETEYLSFRIGENEYSVEIMSVREIRGWTRTTSLPHAPDFVRGVINLRGTVLPVVDLALRLGLEETEPEDRNVIIVVDVESRVMGLRVDAVSDILSFSPDQLQPPPEMTSKSRFVRALTILDDRMVRLLDLEEVLPSNKEVAA
ncbi:MAG: purine-binding chemotaxis protein CheW [Silicimonas sp.]|nr:purine-binding chemotaxis protein CheW [Silicimonas sp.]